MIIMNLVTIVKYFTQMEHDTKELEELEVKEVFG